MPERALSDGSAAIRRGFLMRFKKTFRYAGVSIVAVERSPTTAGSSAVGFEIGISNIHSGSALGW